MVKVIGSYCGEACPDPESTRHHYSVVVKTFASDGKVPLRRGFELRSGKS